MEDTLNYGVELKRLYDLAVKQEDLCLALDILERLLAHCRPVVADDKGPAHNRL